MSDRTEQPQRRTFTPAEIHEVRKVSDALSSHSEECYESPHDPCGKCDQCAMADAIERLERIVEPPDLPVARYQGRLSYEDGLNCEAYFLKEWQDEQHRERTSGHRRVSRLELILDERPSFRDAEVAASVIQWMGTNIGGNFFSRLIRARDRCAEDLKEHQKRKQAAIDRGDTDYE